jgi:hypothetical protein
MRPMAAAERDVAIIVLFSSIASIACTRPTSPTAPVASGTATVSAAPAPSAQSPSAGLPKPDFGPRGPIVATGYPTKIGTGMDDYADWVGFTSDGARFGYCSHYGGLGQLDCVYRDASGTLGKDTDVVAHPETAPSPLDPLKTKAIEKWIASSGMSKMTPVAGTFQVLPPPLKGDWAYARDIELRVLTVDTVLDKSGKTVSQPFLRLGGVLMGRHVLGAAPRVAGDCVPLHRGQRPTPLARRK